MALAVTAYNLKRTITVLGAKQMRPLLGGRAFFQNKNKRPEHVRAFGPRPVRVFSHSLLRRLCYCLRVAHRKLLPLTAQ